MPTRIRASDSITSENTMSRILIALAAMFALNAHAIDLSLTPLGIAAAALQPGQSAKFNTPGYQALPWLSDSFYYGDGAAWNPTTQQIEFVASPVGGTPRYRYTYNLERDQWATEYMPWQTSGHGYDSNTIDAAGTHCFVKYYGPVTCRQSDGSWPALPLPPKPWAPGTDQALTYWPGHGLVLTSRDGQIAIWDGQAWTKVVGAAVWGAYHTWSVLVGDVVYTGANAYAYRLEFVGGQYALTALSAAPWNIAGNVAQHTTDGNHLLVASNQVPSVAGGTLGAWIEFDGANWIARPDLASGAIAVKWHYYVVYIPEIQAIVTMSARTPTSHDVWIVKVGAAAPPPPPPPPDVCASAGVLICDKFDGSPLAGTIYPASSGLTKPYVADGLLNMQVVSNGGKDTGYYKVKFPSVGEGEMIAFAYSKRIDAEAMKHQGSKDFIVWGPAWAPSCTTQQVVMTHMYAGQVPIVYRSCGLGIKIDLADGDRLWQNGDFDCRYRSAKVGDYSKCHTKTADKWARYYVEIKVGHYGQADSRITAQVKTDGQWHPMMDFAFTLPSTVPLEAMMLTGYMTNEPIFEHPLGRVAFDDFIVSAQPLDLNLL